LPLNKQTPFVQNALKQAMGIDYYGNFDQAKSDRAWKEFQGSDGKTAVQGLRLGNEDVTQRLSDAGIPALDILIRG
jgi:hypothetical protein